MNINELICKTIGHNVVWVNQEKIHCARCGACASWDDERFNYDWYNFVWRNLWVLKDIRFRFRMLFKGEWRYVVPKRFWAKDGDEIPF